MLLLPFDSGTVFLIFSHRVHDGAPALDGVSSVTSCLAILLVLASDAVVSVTVLHEDALSDVEAADVDLAGRTCLRHVDVLAR